MPSIAFRKLLLGIRKLLLSCTTSTISLLKQGASLLKSILSDAGGRGGGNAKTGQGGLDSMDVATIEKLRAGLLELLKV